MANKIGTWARGDETQHQWPDETLAGAEWKHWRDWPAHTRGIGGGQFVILDFGLKKRTEFDIEAAIAELQPKAGRKGASGDES